MGRASNTIRNELERGTVAQIKNKKNILFNYYPDAGQMTYERNRLNCRPKYKLLECERSIDHAEDIVKNKKWSLDAIVGHPKVNCLFDESEMVCTKTLYNYVD
jgi:IS30 family transposase